MALETNLKSYWKFNETSGSSAEDYVRSNNGTLQASSSFNVGGKLNYAFYTSADSSTAGVDLGSKSSLDISQYPLSISAWFKTSSAFTQDNGNMVIFSNVKGSSNYSGFHLDMLMGATTGDRGKLQFTYRNNAGTDYTLTTTATYNDGNYHHVVATISSGGAMIIYVDGSSVSSGTTATSTLFTGTKKATIGTNWDVNANGVWVGYLDEVIFWDKEVTSTEVTELYNSGTGKEFYTIQTSYLGSNDDYENGGTNANRAQSFQFQTYDATLTGVSLYGSAGSLASGTSKIVIRSGSITGTEVATTGTFTTTSTLSAYGSPAWNNIPFTTPFSATKDTTYYMVVISLTGSTSDEVRWSTDTTSPSYSYGSRHYATSGDTGWTTDTTRDFNFRIFGTSATVVNVTASPSVLSATFSTPASVISGEGVVTQSTPPSAVFSIPAPVVTGNADIALSVLSATFSLPIPDVNTPDAQVSPSVLTATFSLPASTVTAEQNAVVSSTVLSATFSLPAPSATIVQSVQADPSVLTALFSMSTPVITADKWQNKFNPVSATWNNKY